MKRQKFKQVFLTGMLMLTTSVAQLVAQTLCTSGTLLYKQDFGGNNVSDPVSSPTALPPGSSGMPFKLTSGGFYDLTKNPLSVFGNLSNLGDHTHLGDTTRGYLMMVSTGSGKNGVVLYQTDINDLCGGMKLSFSTYLMELSGLSTYAPQFEMQMVNKQNGAILYTTGTMGTHMTNEWKRYGFDFVLPSGAKDVTFKVINRTTTGNVLAIDDIEIRFCTPPIVIPNYSSKIDKCTGSSITLNGNYTDDGTFGNSLSYRWEYSSTGNIYNQSDWSVVSGSAGVSSNGTISSSHTISSLGLQHGGYYRMIVGTSSSITGWNCRTVSDEINVVVVQNNGAPAYINAPTYMCLGDTVTVSTSTPLTGTWASSNSTIATVEASTGKVTAKSGGTVQIKYIVSNNVCIDTLTATLTVKQNVATANDITVQGNSLCAGTPSVNLNSLVSASGIANPVFRWYSSVSGTTVLSSTVITPPVNNATYYVSVSGDNHCEGAANSTGRKAVTIYVNSLATAANIIITDTTICSAGSVTLTASSTGVTGTPEFRWYNASGVLLHTGASYTTPSVSSQTTYYIGVSGTNLCENTTGNRKAVTVNMGTSPVVNPITAAKNTVCTNNNIQLSSTTVGGVWTMSNTNAQFVGSTTANPVAVRGLIDGKVYVTYTVGTGTCQSKSTFLLKVISTSPKILIGF